VYVSSAPLPRSGRAPGLNRSDTSRRLADQEHTKAPVFSHDELLVSIAHNSPTIDTALWLTASFNEMVEREREARNDSRLGPVELPETLLEADLPEEQYQCAECKVFTYLSQIVCSGCDEVLCHSHASQPCSCAPGVPRTMRVRYADDKLEQLRGKIAENAALPTLWREKFTKVLQTGTPSLKSLRTLVVEAEQIEKMTTLPELDPLRAFVGESYAPRAASRSPRG
jgi:histone demethylase JARID1